MKTCLVMISLIMITFSLSSQNNYSRWLPVSGNICDNHLEYRVRFLERSYSKNYELKIQWKNTNSEKIHFNSYIYLEGKKRDGGRTSVDAMGTSNENWFITTSKTPPTVRIEKVALGADDIYANQVECNHLTGRYQRRNSKTKKESQKEIKDKNPIDEFFNKREKEQTQTNTFNSNYENSNQARQREQQLARERQRRQLKQELEREQRNQEIERERERQRDIEYGEQLAEKYRKEAEKSEQELADQIEYSVTTIVSGIARNQRYKEEARRRNEAERRRIEAEEKREEERWQEELKRRKKLKKSFGSYISSGGLPNEIIKTVEEENYFFFAIKEDENQVSFTNVFSVNSDSDNNIFTIDVKNRFQQFNSNKTFWLYGPFSSISSAYDEKSELKKEADESYWTVLRGEKEFKYFQAEKTRKSFSNREQGSYWGAEKNASDSNQAKVQNENNTTENNSYWGAEKNVKSKDQNIIDSEKNTVTSQSELKPSYNSNRTNSKKIVSTSGQSNDTATEKDFWGKEKETESSKKAIKKEIQIAEKNNSSKEVRVKNEEKKDPVVIKENSAPSKSMEPQTSNALHEKLYELTGRTSLRKFPDSQSQVLRRFAIGDKVLLLEQSSKYWWKVEFENMIGYVKALKLELVK